MKPVLFFIIILPLLNSCNKSDEQFQPTLQRVEKKENKIDKYFKKEETGHSMKDEFSDLKKADESCSADNDGKNKFGCSIK